MAHFGRTSRCGKLTPKPNPRLKNSSKTSQESSAQSGLSNPVISIAGPRGCRVKKVKWEFSLILAILYWFLLTLVVWKNSIFAPKYRLAIFWRNTCDDHISPHKTTSLTSLSRLSCWCGHLPAVTYMAICIVDSLPQFAHAIAKIARVAESNCYAQQFTIAIAKAIAMIARIAKATAMIPQVARETATIPRLARAIAMIPRLVKMIAMIPRLVKMIAMIPWLMTAIVMTLQVTRATVTTPRITQAIAKLAKLQSNCCADGCICQALTKNLTINL